MTHHPASVGRFKITADRECGCSRNLKVIFEDQNFRVITATWKAGATDKPHSHPVPAVNYTLTDCSLVLTEANGATRNINPKAGSVATVPITASHTAHNVGTSDCRSIFVERK